MLSINFLYAGNIRLDFKKTTIENSSTETVGGFIYLKYGPTTGENSVYFDVSYPVNQIMTFTKKETYIYYPDEKKAIVIANAGGNYGLNFIAVSQGPSDLILPGFEQGSVKESDGVIRRTLNAKGGGKSGAASIIIDRDISGRILKFEVKNRDGSIISRLKYSHYIKLDGREIPLQTASYNEEGRSGVEENFILSNPEINNELPEIIKNFKIPAGTKIEKIEMK